MASGQNVLAKSAAVCALFICFSFLFLNNCYSAMLPKNIQCRGGCFFHSIVIMEKGGGVPKTIIFMSICTAIRYGDEKNIFYRFSLRDTESLICKVAQTKLVFLCVLF